MVIHLFIHLFICLLSCVCDIFEGLSVSEVQIVFVAQYITMQRRFIVYRRLPRRPTQV